VRGAVSPDHIHVLLRHRHNWHRRNWCNTSRDGHRESYWRNSQNYARGTGASTCGRGYFCATVGAVDEATIKADIENQKWDDDDQDFKITAPTEP